jgi:hypothetical protein
MAVSMYRKPESDRNFQAGFTISSRETQNHIAQE